MAAGPKENYCRISSRAKSLPGETKDFSLVFQAEEVCFSGDGELGTTARVPYLPHGHMQTCPLPASHGVMEGWMQACLVTLSVY